MVLMLRTFSVVREIPVKTPGESISSLQLTFDSLLGLATPSPHIESNAAELRR